jgi:hypothetical protein
MDELVTRDGLYYKISSNVPFSGEIDGHVAHSLHSRLNIRKEDVMISLVEVNKENWSFGDGEIQYGP